MAKKRRVRINQRSVDPRVINRSKRGAEFQPALLRAQSERLIECAGELAALADAMQAEGIKAVKVDGQSKVRRAVALVQQFTANVEHSVKRATIAKRATQDDTI